MIIENIEIAGREVTAIYNGGICVFYSQFYGVIGIAECTINEENEPIYRLTAGTENTVGGSLTRCRIVTAMKRYINKNGRFYNNKKPIFEDSGEICDCEIEFQLIGKKY